MLNDYQWVQDEPDLALTVAVVGGRPLEEVIQAYGGNPGHPAGTSVPVESWVPDEELGDWFWVHAITSGIRVVMLENNGWAGIDLVVAQRASADGGMFLAVYWSPVGSRIIQATNGRITANFDPLFAADRPYRDDIYPEWIDATVFRQFSLYADMLTALETHAGVAFHREWLTAELPVYRVPRLDQQLPNQSM